MKECVFAYTGPTHNGYPGYVSVNRLENGDVEVTVRAAPTEYDGIYVCGYAADKGQPGRCTPGDDHCNNYCNAAPQKGPMADHALPCRHVKEGATVSYVVPAADWKLA